MPPPNSPESGAPSNVDSFDDLEALETSIQQLPSTNNHVIPHSEPHLVPSARPQKDDMSLPVDESVIGATVNGQCDQVLPFIPILDAYQAHPFPSSPAKKDQDWRAENVLDESLELVHQIDFTAVVYESNVDENLICSICRTPLVDPVMTPCNHIFCRACLISALEQNKTCPIDRSDLSVKMPYGLAPNVVRNQVESLKVMCPMCNIPIIRPLLEKHLTKECPQALMSCPGSRDQKRCPHLVIRNELTEKCMHFQVPCPDCELKVIAIDMDRHRIELCTRKADSCKLCGAEYPLVKAKLHPSACPDVEIPCKWHTTGCTYVSKRKNMIDHDGNCDRRLMGERMKNMDKTIGNLYEQCIVLLDDREKQNQRLKILETTLRNFKIPFDDLISPPEDSDGLLLPSGFEHIMGMMESQQETINKLSSSIDRLEARDANLIYNELLPLRTDMTELRSMQQTTNMHVRWLLNFKIQENRRVRTSVGTSVGTGTVTEAGGSGTTGVRSLTGGSQGASMSIGRNPGGTGSNIGHEPRL